ncbi:MAG TPA: nuclear transport factor 2 family protein [Thermoleophilaceae bacterium]|nr:nuclear transport factor 2 family protein [Thermoleophilaceae bacterium]
MTKTASPSEQELIAQAARDYFEGWYDGDVARMDRVLHPDLVKRGAGQDGPDRLRITTKERMLELTALGEGKADGADRSLDIEVEDATEDTASVTVRSAVYHEYVHLVRTPDGWKIANALWRYA